MNKKYNVTGMGCAMCQARIQDGISKLEGVKRCEVNLLTNSMVVEYDEKIITSEGIVKEVSNLGYGASEEEDLDPHPERVDSNLDKLKGRLINSLIFTVPLILISMIKSINSFLMECIGKVPLLIIEIVLVCLIVYINREIYKSGLSGIKNLAPNMDSLVAIGTIASFLISYYDSIGMILTIITLGKYLEEKAKGRTTDSLKGLISLLPEEATVIRDGKEYVVKPSVISLNEIVIVKPGEKIPADGLILEGETSINESIITGESERVKKTVGDKVIAGSINFDGYIKYRVTEVGKDTVLSKIIKMVEEASNSKAPISRIADKVAMYFVPTVIGIAIITFLIWMLKGSDIATSMNFAISVLVISCPCALGLATPVSIMVGMGRGAKEGVIIKSAVSLENFGKVNTICFDKTGTITKGIVLDKSLEERLSGSREIVNTSVDEIREEAKDVIEKIKGLNIKPVLISGDKEEKVKEIASKVGITEYYHSILPGGKEEIVLKEKEKAKLVSMVGDGVNDSVAIKRSDVGIAMGTGTDIAIEEADIILMGDSLYSLLKAINLSKATIKNIKLSLFWALFYNVICIPLAAGVLSGAGIILNPMIGAALMSLSSITVVTNSLRLRNVKID